MVVCVLCCLYVAVCCSGCDLLALSCVCLVGVGMSVCVEECW